MPKVHADPQKLKEFGQQLKAYAAFIESSMTQLKGDLGRLGDSWRDNEFCAFRDTFTKTQRLLRAFADETRATEKKLQEDAETLERSRRVRMPQ